ncbi:hypothetical protein [Duganella aceris]|uniref:Uncharacterized protein n=1 Tax=Duganella aceris TaxID=2703883 RepID=A0ABX0FS70_9BURK|nr:hypothetical protein [Duganella aceris]NGZ87199.1 hypothetical protein [Duganella aceris]
MHLDESFLQEISNLDGEECWGVTGGSGTGSVISLDIGKKTARAKPVRNAHLTELVRCYESAYSLLLYCPWRMESKSKVLSGSHMSNENDGPMVRGLEFIRGKKIETVTCARPAFDLRIEFEGELSLVIHCSLIGMDADECYVFKGKLGWYSVGFDGRLSLENAET